MYKSPKMQNKTSEFGDIFNPNIHRLHVTLRAVMEKEKGKEDHHIFCAVLRLVTEDLQRLTKFKHSGSESARKLAEVALAAYEPVLQRFMSYISNARAGETYEHYLKRKHFNWGRIRPGSQQSTNRIYKVAYHSAAGIIRHRRAMKKKVSRFYRDLILNHWDTTRYKYKIWDDLKSQFLEVYTYVGMLYAAYNMASFPCYFEFLFHGDGDLKNDILSIGEEPDVFSQRYVRSTFERLQRLNANEDIRAHFFKEYGIPGDSITSFFN